ncbi:MAG: hypothetical protein H7138_05370 [Myxococcales bacterium]|nr:hypothetical protein [Myxococcales bacterium]
MATGVIAIVAVAGKTMGCRRRSGALVVDLNNRVMKRYGKSRRQLFDELDRPELAALPNDRFIHGDWSKAHVKLDYHVNVDHHDYSVPYQRATDEVEIRLSAATVEVFYNAPGPPSSAARSP